MKKLILFLFLFSACKKEDSNKCGTCQYRKITMDATTGKVLDDDLYGGAFSVCGNENLTKVTQYELTLPDSTGANLEYKIVGFCY